MSPIQKFIVAFVAATFGLGIVAEVNPVAAADPVPVVTCSAQIVTIGDVVTCTVSGTNGIATTNVLKARNIRTGAVANIQQLGKNLQFSFVAPANLVGRTGIISADLSITNTYTPAPTPENPNPTPMLVNHLVRHSYGYAYLTVLAPLPVV